MTQIYFNKPKSSNGLYLINKSFDLDFSLNYTYTELIISTGGLAHWEYGLVFGTFRYAFVTITIEYHNCSSLTLRYRTLSTSHKL